MHRMPFMTANERSHLTRKAAGSDEIPTALKLVADEIQVLFPITIVFNESLTTGVLPDEFKIGHLQPLLEPRKSYSGKARSIDIELSRNHADMHSVEGSGESRALSDLQTFGTIRGPVHFTVRISSRPFTGML